MTCKNSNALPRLKKKDPKPYCEGLSHLCKFTSQTSLSGNLNHWLFPTPKTISQKHLRWLTGRERHNRHRILHQQDKKSWDIFQVTLQLDSFKVCIRRNLRVLLIWVLSTWSTSSFLYRHFAPNTFMYNDTSTINDLTK